MSNNPSTLKRKLRLIACVLVGIVATVFILLEAAFMMNTVRPDQLQPPKELISIKPSSTTHTLARASKLYDKWSPEKTAAIDWTSWSLETRNFEVPLTTKQTNWLTDHREFINDMMQLASAGGIPAISYEQAAALSRIKNYQSPTEYMFCRHIVMALTAESHRRRNAGDESGAADALIAAYRISKSFSRPFLMNVLVGQLAQMSANKELKLWICEGTMTSGTAQRFRVELAVNAITQTDFKRAYEVDYLFKRVRLVEALTGKFSELMEYESFQLLFTSFDQKLLEINNKKLGKFLDTQYLVSRVALRSAYMKLTASKRIEQFDAAFRQTQSDIENNTQLFGQDPIYDSMYQYFKLHRAQTRMNLLALDLISGTTASLQIDPFSNKPLGRIEETSDTLIYSIGLDYKDQHGAVTYDPDNENGGDVTMRVPRRRK